WGLQMARASAERAIHGHAAPETLRVYTRARDLLDETVPAKEQLAVLYGLFAVSFVRGEYAAARPVAEQALAVAAPESDPEATAFANRMMGIVDWATGDFLAAAPRLRRVADTRRGVGTSPICVTRNTTRFFHCLCWRWLCGHSALWIKRSKRLRKRSRELSRSTMR